MVSLLKRRFRVKEYRESDNEQATMFLATNDSAKQVNDSAEQTEYDAAEIEIKPARVICPDCGGITIEGLDYCHRCGGELKPVD